MCRRYTLNAAALPAGLQRLWPGFAQQLTLDGFPAAEESIVPGKWSSSARSFYRPEEGTFHMAPRNAAPSRAALS